MLFSACDAAAGGTTAASELHLPPRCRCPDVPVYLGMVEFISKQEWEAELEILIDECCNAEGNLYSVAPSESLGSAENLLAAWQKVETVYGQGTLTSRCRDGISKHRMLDILHGNARVNRLLSQTVRVDAGSVRAATTHDHWCSVGRRWPRARRSGHARLSGRASSAPASTSTSIGAATADSHRTGL
jgi:hypothetical protein